MTSQKPILELELRPVSPVGPDGVTVYALLPALDELLGAPGFGRRNAICLPGTQAPFDPLSFFAPFGATDTWH
jgi:hypothetical protein